MLDLLVTDATLPDGREHMSIAVQDGRIVEENRGGAPCPTAACWPTMHVRGNLESAPSTSSGVAPADPRAPQDC